MDMYRSRTGAGGFWSIIDARGTATARNICSRIKVSYG
jgi:hypothetical protein